MNLRPLAGLAVAAVVLTACAPQDLPTANPTPTPSADGAPTLTTAPRTSQPSRSETRPPAPTPSADATLPAEFRLDGQLVDNAEEVVAELHRVAGDAPALKLDVTTEQATLSVVTTEGTVRTYRWREDTVAVVDSDVQYLGQATFNPGHYPLHDLPRILDVAALLAGSSSNQVLQVVEYRAGDIYMSVTTLPESRTVFFQRDGTTITPLGTHSVADISSGLAEVTGSTLVVLAVGFNTEQGYWADVPKPGGIIERRIRTGMLPMFAAQRSQTLGITPFDPALLDAAAIARSIAAYRSAPDETCSVEVDNRHERVQPVIRYDCGGSIHHSDLQGRDMTGQFQS